jgi:hypothetical protein
VSDTNPIAQVESLAQDLQTNPPTTLADARTKLEALVGALHKANDALWHGNIDKQAVLANISVGVEAATVATAALAEVKKGEDAAAAALAKVNKVLNAPRVVQRVWNKLVPQQTAPPAGQQTAPATDTTAAVTADQTT